MADRKIVDDFKLPEQEIGLTEKASSDEAKSAASHGSENLIQITDADFEEKVLKSTLPVVVDFWAPWCGPCKTIAPILEKIAPAYAGRLIIAKMNVDDSPETPAEYGVRGIPTLLLFKEGEEKARKVGAEGEAKLTAWIEENI